MAFTFNLTLPSGRVRLHLGDSLEDAGPRPNGLNYTDVEINYFLNVAVSISGAVILGYKTLAAEWSAFALTERAATLFFDAREVAQGYRDQADYIADNPLEEIGGGAAIIPITREDAYSGEGIEC